VCGVRLSDDSPPHDAQPDLLGSVLRQGSRSPAYGVPSVRQDLPPAGLAGVGVLLG
jgi:hypothetical protein